MRLLHPVSISKEHSLVATSDTGLFWGAMGSPLPYTRCSGKWDQFHMDMMRHIEPEMSIPKHDVVILGCCESVDYDRQALERINAHAAQDAEMRFRSSHYGVPLVPTLEVDFRKLAEERMGVAALDFAKLEAHMAASTLHND